ncbi:MAG: hypothetical protein IKN59_01250 [Paludibacteraceae bacterium]|nr:hypothetical protein [Paludibacteraceae bacterium]
MKRIVPILFIALVGLLFSSCLDTKSEFTPEISVSKFYTLSGDTLSFRFDSQSNCYNIDSILVGDTITGAVGFAALGNMLVSTHVGWDSTYLEVWSVFTDEFKNILLSNSDLEALNLYFPTGYNYLGLPLYIVPQKAGSTALKLTVVTDSKFSPREETLILNITE